MPANKEADVAEANEKQTAATAGGAEQVQAKMDEEQEQGFRGVKVDPTPNEHYTVAGVIAGKPTPETDPDAAAEARKASGR